jgi:hypothetical protein
MEKKIDFTNTEILTHALNLYVREMKKQRKYFLIDRAKALINRIKSKENAEQTESK